MTDVMTNLRTLVEKAPGGDVLRDTGAFAAERLTEDEVSALTGRGWSSATAIASAIGRPGPASSSCASPGCVKASTPKQKRLALAGPLSAAGNARAARRWLANPHLANPNLALSDAHLPRIGDPMAAGRFRELGERAGL